MVALRSPGVVVREKDLTKGRADITTGNIAGFSAPDAFVEGIMEGKEWIWNNGILTERHIETFKKEIDSATLYNLQETKVSAFAKFLKDIEL